MNEFNPQMYTKNLSASTPYRTLFEIHNDGAYISHLTSGTNWIKLQEASRVDNKLYGLFNGGLQEVDIGGEATFQNIYGTIVGSTDINIQNISSYVVQTGNTVTIQIVFTLGGIQIPYNTTIALITGVQTPNQNNIVGNCYLYNEGVFINAVLAFNSMNITSSQTITSTGVICISIVYNFNVL
jgi:hypothetical protein